ncbi:hypothetical protein [Pseudophaeobacter sp.]|uniref:hypothetical protein n=1 Tax=Pseudophaeobacter sp. TaxID=1971739 RepID=UPI004057EE84
MFKHFIMTAALLPQITIAQERTLAVSGLPVWDSAALLYLVEAQPLADQGITFTFEPWQAPEELSARLARQDIAIASTPSILVPVLAARGVDIAMLGGSAPAGNIQIVSSSENGDIAVPFRGGMPDLILQSLGGTDGFTPRYAGTPPEAMQLFLSGQVSATFLAEPLVTVVAAQAEAEVTLTDVCTLWRDIHGTENCAVTGAYVAVGLADEEAHLIAEALSDAYDIVGSDATLAGRLLKDSFPVLAQAPLAIAFSNITPEFHPMCDIDGLTQTLNALSPYAPFPIDPKAVPSKGC